MAKAAAGKLVGNMLREGVPDRVILELSVNEALLVRAAMGSINTIPFEDYLGTLGDDGDLFSEIGSALDLERHDTYELRDTYDSLVAIVSAMLPEYNYEAADALSKQLRGENNETEDDAPSLTFTYHGIRRKVINPEFKGTLLGGLEVEKGGVAQEGQYKNYHLDEVNR